MARVMDTSHPGLPGRSLRDKIQDDLDEAMVKFLDEAGMDKSRVLRGVVRGLAMALAHVSVDLEHRPTAKQLEQESKRRVSDGR